MPEGGQPGNNRLTKFKVTYLTKGVKKSSIIECATIYALCFIFQGKNDFDNTEWFEENGRKYYGKVEIIN